MGQQSSAPTNEKKRSQQPSSIPSIPITKKQTSISIHILMIPKELFNRIASFMDTESQLTLAYTCKMLYAHHKHQCREETFTLVRELPQYENIPKHIRTLERCMGQNGWESVKVILKIASVNAQNNYDHPIRALWLNVLSPKLPSKSFRSLNLPSNYFSESFKLHFEPINLPDGLDGLDCANLNALIVSLHRRKIVPSITFLEKAPNLNSIVIHHAIIDDDTLLMFSKLPSLKFISLNNCKMTKVHLSKIFEGCTTLEEIQLIYCAYYDATLMKFPPKLKKFEIEHCYEECKVDASLCTRLRYL